MDSQPSTPRKDQRLTPTISTIRGDGALVELIHDPAARRTSLIVGQADRWTIQSQVQDQGRQLVPYSAQNELIAEGVVLLPSEPQEYVDEATLVDEIAHYIHRYVDVSPRFERLASYYVLFSWVYDAFNEVPYLRLRGEYGSGKTRFLLTVGSVCYKPIFASAASTVSPIFHLLDTVSGTLVIDEGDFRYSDEKAEIVKILNNGNVQGFPVLRSERTASGEFSPRAFRVFGPKIVASRGYYEDRALESRFITEETGRKRLRADVPINLPNEYAAEALALRNKLLLYRLRTRPTARPNPAFVDPTVEPRLNQIAVPLLSIIDRPAVREELRGLLREYHRDLVVDRGLGIEGQVLEAVHACLETAQGPAIPLRDVAQAFVDRSEGDLQQQITNKWIGSIVRRRLQIKTQKSHGIYVIPLSEREKLEHLFTRYGVGSTGNNKGNGTSGTSGTSAEENVAKEGAR